MASLQFLIVHPQTRGNEHDARVLGAALRDAFSDASVTYLPLGEQFNHDYRTPLGAHCPRAKSGTYDAVFLIELARMNPPLFDPGFARRFFYVPHIEWMNPADEASLSLGLIDTVLAKNELTRSVLSTLPALQKVRHLPVTGWSSRDTGLGPDPWSEARFDRFLHVRGVSQFKQTDVVVETWKRHPEWPPLLVTAYVRDPLSFDAPLSYGPNISVILKPQTDEEMVAQARAHGVHVIPSFAESFGHVLNEARAVGALLVTTDAPPMNDLVEDGKNGVLVDVARGAAVPHFRSHGFPVTGAALEKAVSGVLAMPLEARAEMGRAARRAYEEGRDAFHRAIASLEV